jgi:hypothetical protein
VRLGDGWNFLRIETYGGLGISLAVLNLWVLLPESLLEHQLSHVK